MTVEHDDPWKVPAITPMPRAGSALLYQSASGLEKAMADVESEYLIGLYAEAIIDVWNPWQISLENLPYLAWAMGVNIWEDGWSEATQRAWTDEQFRFKALRGTIDGIAMALDFAGRDFVEPGYELLEWVTPPQGFFVSPGLTKEEWDYWVHLMPEIRIQFARGVGSATGDEFYIEPEEGWGNLIEDEVGVGGDGFIGMMGIGVDDGPSLWGRRAILRRNGVDTDINIWTMKTTIDGRPAVDYEQISIEGLSTVGEFVGDYFLGEDKFICAEEIAPQLYSIRIDSTYDHISSIFHLDTIIPGLKPLDVRHEIESDIGSDLFPEHFMFVGDGIIGADFIDNGRDAAEMLADRVFLFDPNVAAMQTAGASFIGVDRISFPKYTMELMIDLHTRDNEQSLIVSEGYLGDWVYISKQDMTHINRAARAVVAAKAFRDRAWLVFDPTRELELRDYVDETTELNQQIRQLL